MGKHLVSLSGGMDSATVLTECLAQNPDEGVEAVGFYYGSKHNFHENEAAKKIAKHYKVAFDLIDFSAVTKSFQSDLLNHGGDIPEGHYEEQSMEKTVVPGRNLIFASILSGLAWSRGANKVWMGPHQGDHAIYPDCRPQFFYLMSAAVDYGTDGRVELVAPFLFGDKYSILKRGFELGVPYHLTRTCYKNQEVACGKCGACQERISAFWQHGVKDPIEYESRKIFEKQN